MVMCFKRVFCALFVLYTLLNLTTAYHGFFPGPRHDHFHNSHQFRRQAFSNNFRSNGFNWDDNSDNQQRPPNGFPTNDAIFFPRDVDSSQSRPWESGNSWGNVNPWGGGRQSNNQNSVNSEQNSSPSPIPTSTVAVPGMGTPRTPCEDACQVTPEYNPVCGSNGITYFNERRLTCAQNCGKRVTASFNGRCVNQG